ncbi:MAG: hypothetical protein QOF53_2444, partial [Nocardioidaceae bacterium]|nr:hypothetical protein [Nocardioidaceae bacterium]
THSDERPIHGQEQASVAAHNAAPNVPVTCSVAS